MGEILREQVNSIVEESERHNLEAETYGSRLRVFRAGLILLVGGVSAVGGMIVVAPVMSELPFPLGVLVPAVSGIVGLAVGSLIGEVVSIAAAKLTTRFIR